MISKFRISLCGELTVRHTTRESINVRMLSATREVSPHRIQVRVKIFLIHRFFSSHWISSSLMYKRDQYQNKPRNSPTTPQSPSQSWSLRCLHSSIAGLAKTTTTLSRRPDQTIQAKRASPSTWSANLAMRVIGGTSRCWTFATSERIVARYHFSDPCCSLPSRRRGVKKVNKWKIGDRVPFTLFRGATAAAAATAVALERIAAAAAFGKPRASRLPLNDGWRFLLKWINGFR